MWIILGLLIGSMILGYFLQNHLNEKLLNQLLLFSIYLLLFLMGVNIGSNEQLIKNLSSLGWQALLLTIGAVIGSIIAAKILFYFWKRK
jgi:uncharacterized transporter YbjL